MNTVILFSLLGAVNFFGDKNVFQEPIAYPRSPETSVSVNSAKYYGHRIEYINAEIGRDLPLVTFGELIKYQFVLQGGTWVALGYRDGAFPLLTQDFYFSLGPAFKWNTFSGTLKFNHISAHLGDGIDDLIYETLSQKEKNQFDQANSMTGDRLQLVQPKNYSRDYLSAQLAWNPPRITSGTNRLYVQAGYAHKMIPRTLGRWYAGVGNEMTYPGHSFDYFTASDLTWNQDVDSFDYSLRSGIEFGDSSSLFNTQIALTVYSGSDRRGQLVGRNLTQVGFGVFIQ